MEITGKIYVDMDGILVREASCYIYTVELSKATDYGFHIVHSMQMKSSCWIPEVTEHIPRVNGGSYLKEYTLYAAPKSYIETHGFIEGGLGLVM